MDFTVKVASIKDVNRQVCLRKKDIKSIREKAEELLNTKSDDDALRIARQIVNLGTRNNKALGNEDNINFYKNVIVEHTTSGDILTTASVETTLYHFTHVDHTYANGQWAVLAALDDLVNEGYLRRERKSIRIHEYNSPYQVWAYIVN